MAAVGATRPEPTRATAGDAPLRGTLTDNPEGSPLRHAMLRNLAVKWSAGVLRGESHRAGGPEAMLYFSRREAQALDMNHDESYPWLQELKQLQQSIASMTCSELVDFLEGNWEKLPISHIYFYVLELSKKQCKSGQAMAFFRRLLEAEDPFYRVTALEFIKESGGRESRQIFFEVARRDHDDSVVQEALLSLTDLFRDQKDREILSLASGIYEDHETSTQLKLAAAATMMYQLGIPHDATGRPAWWDEDEETIDHPALQRAIAETREILTT